MKKTSLLTIKYAVAVTVVTALLTGPATADTTYSKNFTGGSCSFSLSITWVFSDKARASVNSSDNDCDGVRVKLGYSMISGGPPEHKVTSYVYDTGKKNCGSDWCKSITRDYGYYGSHPRYAAGSGKDNGTWYNARVDYE